MSTGFVKHGHCSSRGKSLEYRTWQRIKQLCTYQENPQFYLYGGRGIKICDNWLKFENFINDMGSRPTLKHSLRRINIDGDFEPTNCAWTLKHERNKRPSEGPKIFRIRFKKIISTFEINLAENDYKFILKLMYLNFPIRAFCFLQQENILNLEKLISKLKSENFKKSRYFGARTELDLIHWAYNLNEKELLKCEELSEKSFKEIFCDHEFMIPKPLNITDVLRFYANGGSDEGELAKLTLTKIDHEKGIRHHYKFNQWFKILVALSHTQSLNGLIIEEEKQSYKEYFDDGHTPEEVINMELQHYAKYEDKSSNKYSLPA